MNTVETCSSVLDCIRKTRLNFVFSESPFGINISLKKSFRKDYIQENCEPTSMADQIEFLEARLKNVTQEGLTKDTKIKDLKSKNEILKSEVKETLNNIEEYRLNDKKLLKQLKDKDKEIYDLKRDLENKKESNVILSTECKELKVELAQEKKESTKLLKKESKKNSNKNASNETSSQTDIYKCELCRKSCNSEVEIDHHMKLIHKESVDCFSQTSEVKLTEKSSQSGINMKFDQYPCFYCEEVLFSQSHSAEHHTSCGKFSSPFLQKPSKPEPKRSKDSQGNQQSFYKFFSDLHDQLHPKIPCNECDITVESQEMLQLHKKVFHRRS